MPPSAPYPVHNLYLDRDWTARLAQTGLGTRPLTVERVHQVPRLRTAHWYLVDLEAWPGPQSPWAERRLPWRLVPIGQFNKLAAAARPASLPRGSLVWPSMVAPFLDLGRPAGISARTVGSIRRKARKLEREVGPLSLRQAEAPTRWFDEWLRFHLARKAAASPLSLPGPREAYRRFLTAAPPPAWMHLFELDAGARPLCRIVAYAWNGVFYYGIPAMTDDPSLAAYSPGLVLVDLLIQWSLERKLEIFDFQQGDEGYKMLWHPEVRPLYSCEVGEGVAGRAILALRARQLRRRGIAFEQV